MPRPAARSGAVRGGAAHSAPPAVEFTGCFLAFYFSDSVRSQTLHKYYHDVLDYNDCVRTDLRLRITPCCETVQATRAVTRI